MSSFKKSTYFTSQNVGDQQCTSSQNKNSFYRLSMNSQGWLWAARADSAFLISEFPHGTQLRSLLVHQNSICLYKNGTGAPPVAKLTEGRGANRPPGKLNVKTGPV